MCVIVWLIKEWDEVWDVFFKIIVVFLVGGVFNGDVMVVDNEGFLEGLVEYVNEV